MANGVDIGAHGNGIFCVSRLGAAPSLLSGFVVLMLVLARLLSDSVISHVSQPSADMKFGTVPESLSVFDGEAESNSRFSGLVETVVVELGDFVHSHSEIFSVEGPCEFLVFSLLPILGLVTGISTFAPGMTFVTVSHGCWLAFGSCMHSSLSSSLWLSFLPLLISGVTGTQDGSLLMSRCPCSFLMAGDAGCGAEFDGIEEEYPVRELAVSCPCAVWLDDGYVWDAGTSLKGQVQAKIVKMLSCVSGMCFRPFRWYESDPQLALRSSVLSLRQSHVAGQPRSLV